MLVGGGRCHRIDVAAEIKAFEEGTSIDRYTKGFIYSASNGTKYTPDEILRENYIWFERPLHQSMVTNDCSTHTFNYLFRHPVFVKREQVHALALDRAHRKADSVDQRKKEGGYSLKIFNDFVVKDGFVYSLKELNKFDIKDKQGYEELEQFVKAGMIHSDFRNELVLVGTGFRDHAYTHSSVFLRIKSKGGKPLIVHLDCDQTHPQCSNHKLLEDVTSTQLDWKYFSKYQLMRIFALERRSVAQPDEEEEYLKFAKKIIEGKKEEDPQILKQKRANLSSKMHSA